MTSAANAIQDNDSAANAIWDTDNVCFFAVLKKKNHTFFFFLYTK